MTSRARPPRGQRPLDATRAALDALYGTRRNPPTTKEGPTIMAKTSTSTATVWRRHADEAVAVADKLEAKARARRDENIRRGQQYALLSRARQASVIGAVASTTGQLVARAARRAARVAEEELRAASEADADRLDTASGTRLVRALEAFEAAEARAARFGDGSPYADGSASFFADVYQADNGSQPAARRLADFARHTEMRAGLGITSSFVAPAFDIDAYADVPRQEQVYSALVAQRPLPKGASLSVPQFSASGSVAATGQNTAPVETDIVDQFLERPVGWAAGMFTVSAQLWERSWDPGFDQAAAEVLTAAFDEDLESQCFTGTGSAAQLLGVLGTSNLVQVAYTDTAPTAVKMLPSIAGALSVYAQARKKTATAIFMTPPRWAWLASGEDSQARPLLVPTGPPGSTEPGGTSPVGTIGGVAVFTTTGIPTNLGAGADQDVMVICRPEDARLYLGPPRFAVFTDTETLAGQLSYVLAFHSSAALIADRYPSVTVSGTGFTQPVF